MNSNYKKLSHYIRPVNKRNTELKIETLLGVSIQKILMPSIANTVGTNMKTYKIIEKNQFAYGPVTSRNGDKISIALLQEFDEAIISQAYTVFEVVDTNKLHPEYLMMWFRRPEFDRYARFKSHGSARETFDWVELCEVELPIPAIEKQREIVKEYNTVTNRIKLNEQLNQKLEETAQALYKHWFVDFEFPNEEGKPYKSSSGEMVYNEELDKEIPVGWEISNLKNVCSKIASGATPKGGKQSYQTEGVSLIRSMNVHDNSFIEDDLAYLDANQASKLSNVEIKEEDILINITGASVARCCIVPLRILPARVNQHVMIIRPLKHLALNNYLLYVLYSVESKRDLKGVSEAGSTRQAITKSEIENFRILKPKESLLKNFDNKIYPIAKKRNELDMANKLFNQMKILLLSKMVTLEEKPV